MPKDRTIVLNEAPLNLNDIISIARGSARITVSESTAFRNRIENSRKLLDNALMNGIPVYGTTTGYGKSCSKRMARETAIKNGANLLRFHGCGTGEPLGIEVIRAAMTVRMACFARGYSGVSMELIGQLAAFLNNGITPVVPSEGSVGASGDLTPMSYVAATLTGERDVFYKGKRMAAKEAMAATGISPHEYGPKEPLAMINGTPVMTGIAVMAAEKAHRIAEAAIAVTGLSIHAMSGNAHHYHQSISDAKPHPGQALVARTIRRYLSADMDQSEFEKRALETLQDPYSLRCSPQIIGVLMDALSWIRTWIETEANSANDNPLIDPSTGEILMGGNFYGGHIAFAMDSLKAAVASVADMCDRQISLMVDPHTNRGLPADLVATGDVERMYNHGFKAMSISSSALTAEALKLTMPAASFSRSTESHNQDKVSMGTIAARDAERICELTARVLAIHTLVAAQACDIRGKTEGRKNIHLLLKKVRGIAEGVTADRPMDRDIENIAGAIIRGEIGIAEADE